MILSRVYRALRAARSWMKGWSAAKDRQYHEMSIAAPSEPGKYVLAIDLVHEGITWFSQAGSPCHRISVRVQ